MSPLIELSSCKSVCPDKILFIRAVSNGLHIHVNRNCFGEDREEQDVVIARILYFVEHHWNELLRFSRRSEYAMNRWVARYGFEKTGREILNKAIMRETRYGFVMLFPFQQSSIL